MSGPHLRVVVCGAGPATGVRALLSIADRRGWTTSVTLTEAAVGFFDPAQVEEVTGAVTRNPQSESTLRILPVVDALIVAPATFNTINKLALGIADTQPLTSAAELIGRGVPTVIVPFVNSALAGRIPFRRAVSALRDEGVHVFLGADMGWEPHPPGTGAARQAAFPWREAFEAAARMAAMHR